MFEYIRGTLTEITPERAVIDVGGIGYKLFIPLHCYADGLKIETTVTFYTCFVVREDSQRLFGFLKRSERDLFIRLSEVSGIGPKTAMNLIGHLGIENLEQAILTANTAILSKVPGIGRKTAERLTLEMRDKIQKTREGPKVHYTPGKPDRKNDTISALINLGYTTSQATKAAEQAVKSLGKEATLTQLIAAALKTPQNR